MSLTLTRVEDSVRIYVGNLSFNVSEDDLRAAFEPFGSVGSIDFVRDKVTRDPKGFAFVEMPDKAQAQAAIDALNGKDLSGRALTVNEARPRPEGSRGGRRDGGGRPS
jgi:RNA recognition motif-containing protein